jgi:dTDP-4-dehydrorhamnose reductase
MNILVTGANGQLGREFRCLSEGSADRWVFTDISAAEGLDTVLLDITDPAAVRALADAENIGLIINCAGYTDVEAAEDNPEAAARLNTEAPASLACIARDRDAALIHISTDFVFDGKGCRPLKEDDPTGPLNVYGRTKLEGERTVLSSGCRAIVIRTSWMYSPYGRNFVKTMMRLTAQKDSLRVVSDQVGTPTLAADLASFIIHVIETGQLSKTGLYHFSGDGAVSRFDFACAVRDLCGNACDIQPCLSADYPSKAMRPAYSALDKSLVRKTFGVEIPSWRESLEACIRRMA